MLKKALVWGRHVYMQDDEVGKTELHRCRGLCSTNEHSRESESQPGEGIVGPVDWHFVETVCRKDAFKLGARGGIKTSR